MYVGLSYNRLIRVYRVDVYEPVTCRRFGALFRPEELGMDLTVHEEQEKAKESF